MTCFELFCMIYYVLDAFYDQNKNDIVGQFLSDANPFLFEDSGSADPAVFEEFCSFVNEPIEPGESYSVANMYIEQLCNQDIANAFKSISKSEWDDGLNSYLSSPHKE